MQKITKNAFINLNIFLVLVLIIIAGAGTFMYFKQTSDISLLKKENAKLTESVANKKNIAVNEAKEKFSDQEKTEQTPLEKLQPEQKFTDADLAMIKEAFAKKYNKSIDDVSVKVSKSTATLASGGVGFAGEMGGGWFLAAKVGDKWVIVDDGNGTISCQKIAPYNFPVSMVPECYDEVKQDVVIR